jgi:type VI secretion system secreted protein VgrG
MHIPRIGQEVLVSFLEGDPDRPIITGRVYNGDEMPPYELPANATQSGIKSRSTKGGSTDNFNEIRFEDKKGEEQVYIHAEKDLQAIVENDQAVDIGNDLTLAVANLESRSVGKDRSSEVGENDTLKVGKRFVLEAGDEVMIKTGASSITMKKDGTIQIKGVDITVDGSKSIAQKAGKEIKLDTTQLKASGVQVQIKGTQTVVEGTIVEVKAGAMLTLKGSLTKIN